MRRAMIILLTACGVALAATAASAAFADPAAEATPKNFNYELKDGKRVPRAERTVGPDGVAREEVRKGSCVTVKEKSPNGDVKTSSRCD